MTTRFDLEEKSRQAPVGIEGNRSESNYKEVVMELRF